MRWRIGLPFACLLGCGGPPSQTTTDGTSTGEASTGEGPGSAASTDEPSTGEPASCPEGQASCPCGPEQACADGLACVYAVCVALDCEAGTLACACLPGGGCGPDQACNAGGLCEHDGLCPYTEDGLCDVPDYCPPGSDVVDCCATPGDGVCEEASMGGACADGTDMFDCGYCVYEADGECDEPEGTGFCPEGSDALDCCATPGDGVCEEDGMGGACPAGSDLFDCNYCPTIEDGVCDEVEVIGGLCPPGTDTFDCCATPKDGFCEEENGKCPAGSDVWDCGYCPWAGDGECDEPEGTDLCGETTDPEDCP